MDFSILTEFGTKTYDLADLPQDILESIGIPVDDPFDRLFPPGLLAPSIKVAPISYMRDGFIDRQALTLMWKKAVSEKKRRYAMLIGPPPHTPTDDPFAPSPEFSGGFSISQMPLDVADALTPLADSRETNGNAAMQSPSVQDLLDAAASQPVNPVGGPSDSSDSAAASGRNILLADAQTQPARPATQSSRGFFDTFEDSFCGKRLGGHKNQDHRGRPWGGVRRTQRA